MASSEQQPIPSPDGGTSRERQGPFPQRVEMSGFPFPGELGRKIFQLHERGLGRLFGYSLNDAQEPSKQNTQALMFGMPYRASKRRWGPETEALLISPIPESQEGYLFMVISPALDHDAFIDFGTTIMSPGEPVIFSEWRPEQGESPFSAFLNNRKLLIPSIEVVYEITGEEAQQKVWRDALGRTEALDAKHRIAVDEAAIHGIGGEVEEVIAALNGAMNQYQNKMSSAIIRGNPLPPFPSKGSILGEYIDAPEPGETT